MTQPLLQIETLAVSFPAGASSSNARIQVVRNVSLDIHRGKTLAIVGESGCGKSMTCLSILRLVPTPPAHYDNGRILWYGSRSSTSATHSEPIDLLTLNDKQMRPLRGSSIAMIFQEPMTSLNPVYTIGEQLLEAILLHQQVNQQQAVAIAQQALQDVGIADPVLRLREYPHQLSGGMRQRVMIAMALSCQPQLLLADEPTTALDVTIQAQILQLLRSLQQKRNMAILLVTHDLGVVAENAHTVAVMYAGRIVEYGPVETIFSNPLHPYTQGLFASMPTLESRQERLTAIAGNVPNPAEFPAGCSFHPRCAAMKGDPQCAGTVPHLVQMAADHWVACCHVHP